VFAHRGRDQLTWNELMNQSYPVPPPELGASLRNSAPHQYQDRLRPARELWLINHAYAAGADMELEACCEWLYMNGYNHVISARLRDARRPEPPSLKEQAFDALHGIHDQGPTPEQVAIIRRALEALDD
jgi:hypothetical protein